MRISEDQETHFRRHGYVLIEGFLSEDELAAVNENAHDYLPTWPEYAAAEAAGDSPWRPAMPFSYGFFGGSFGPGFPWRGQALNDVSTSPAILDIAEHLLGTDDLTMSRALLWGKYPSPTHDFDQLLHTDHLNNTLVYPSPEPKMSSLPWILYLNDVTEETGPTHVVSLEHTGHVVGKPNLAREEHPEVYEHEVAMTGTAGSLLLYTMRTFHRGSTFTATTGTRQSLHNVYRPAAHDWLGVEAWAGLGSREEMVNFLTTTTPRQRALVGFPRPGHPYWNEGMLELVQRRYPEMDMSAYRADLPSSASGGRR